VQVAPGMENAGHLCVSVFSHRYWTVHSMTASFTIASCVKPCLQVMVVAGFRAAASVVCKHYRAKRRSFQ
jgi:hypothetical protein